MQICTSRRSEISLGTMWRYFGALLAGFILFTPSSYSEKAPYTFLKEATSAPAMTHHDYIIIGGGTAGCPLAATLAQNASVLVLERGGSPYGDPAITNPRNFFINLLDNSPKSPVQKFVSEDGVINHRARILGGGSAINAGFYTRAGSSYVAGAGWDPNLVEESYEWAEKSVAFEPEVAYWQLAVRNGLAETGVLPDHGFSLAELVGTKIGGTSFDKGGVRHTAADLLQEANPAMIQVLLHATVQKVLFRHNNGSTKPEAYGVIYKDENKVLHTAYLNNNNNSKNEIILSAGTLGSPQLLMLSGIGPAQHLKAQGIDVVLEQPMIGQGMADNPMSILLVPSPGPVGASLVQVIGYTKTGIYIGGVSGVNLISSVVQTLPKDFQHLFNQTYRPLAISQDDTSEGDHTTIKAGIIVAKVESPLSTGHLELKNTNPDLNPAVTFNYLKEKADVEKCVEGTKTLINLVESGAYSRFRQQGISVESLLSLVVKSPVNMRPRHANATTSLEQFCIDTVMSMWNSHGGCHVGSVVDKDYKVLGVDGLRVIDSSTLRSTPGANPQATVMMLGRYMGIRILKDRLGK